VTVWVDSKFIDATAKTVTPKKLNLRGGPGENYSVSGVIEKGAVVNEVGAKDNWTKIEAPASAYRSSPHVSEAGRSGNVPVNPPPSTETPAPTPTNRSGSPADRRHPRACGSTRADSACTASGPR